MATLSIREPLGDLPLAQKNGSNSSNSMSHATSAYGAAARKGGTRRTRPTATNKHVNRVRASRSAGDLGAPVTASGAAYRPRADMISRPTSAKVFQNIFGDPAGRGAAVGQLASKSAVDVRGGGGGDPAPRERLAARRRQGLVAKPGSAGPSTGKSSKFVKAVQTLEPSSRQALLGAIKAERETRELQLRQEEDQKTMRQEASDALAATRAQYASASIFDVFQMVEAQDPLVQFEGCKRILHFCSVVSTPCPAMLRRVHQAYDELLGGRKNVEAAQTQRLEQQRSKHEKSAAAHQRKHKEDMSALGRSLSDEFEGLKSERDAVRLMAQQAETEASELRVKLGRETERMELLAAQVTVIKRENATRMPQRVLPPAEGEDEDAAAADGAAMRELQREFDRQAKVVEIQQRSIASLENKAKLETVKRNSIEQQLAHALAATPASAAEPGPAAAPEPAAAAAEQKTMQTRLRKLHHASKKDKAEITQLQEALSHTRAQLKATMERQDAAAEAAEQQLGDYSAQLKTLQVSASRGGAPTLNLDRGGGLPAALEGSIEVELGGGEAGGSSSNPFSGRGADGSPDLDEMFGGGVEAESSFIAAEQSFVDVGDEDDAAAGGGGLDSTFFVGEEEAVGAAAAGGELTEQLAEMAAENAALRADLEALQARGGPDDFDVGEADEDEDEEDDESAEIQISRQLLAEDRGYAPPYARPATVPSLDFDVLATRIEKLDEEEAAEAEAEAAAHAAEAAEKGESVVLEEVVDPNYKPSETDIVEYAMFLGIDVQAEPELIFIAEQGLMAPLPAEWKPCAAPSGEIYYFNFENGESVWDHPGDEHYRAAIAAERSKGNAGARPRSKAPMSG